MCYYLYFTDQEIDNRDVRGPVPGDWPSELTSQTPGI